MDKPRAIKAAFVCAMFLFAGLVLIQTHFRPFKDTELKGAEKVSALPALTVENIISAKYQSGLQSHAGRTMGFRGDFIKLFNHLNFKLFHVISPLGTEIVVGRGNSLMERGYIDAYNRHSVRQAAEIEADVLKLRKLQDLLEQRGVKMLFVITPSKARVLPEDLNQRYLKQRPGGLSDYEKMLPLLQRHGVRHIDGEAYILSLKGKLPSPLFPRSGIHWDYHASLLFTQELFREMAQLTGKRLDPLEFDGVAESREAQKANDDLARLANLASRKALHDKRYYYPNYKPHKDDPAIYRPRITIVGGSFCQMPIDHLITYGAASEVDYFFYFHTRFRSVGGEPLTEVGRVDRDAVRTPDYLLGRDVVLVEMNTSTAIADLNATLNGFLDKAITELSEGGR